MKIHKLLPLALAAFILGSCASDNTTDGKTDGTGETSYLAINLVSVGNAGGTRADANEDYMDNGTANESHINDIRFYFFNADGSPYTLAGNGVNWTSPSDDFNGESTTPGSNVSNKSEAVLVIRSESGNAAPYSIIAVANPSSLSNNLAETLGNSSKSLEQIKSNVNDKIFFATDATGSDLTNYQKAAKAKNFVMSNSVYEQAGQAVCESFVSGHVASTPEKAKANPVDIYIERVVAKVSATIDESAGWEKGDGTNWDTDEYGMKVGQTTGGIDVWAVVKGWNVADENGMAQLTKAIETGWTSDGLGFPAGEKWSTTDYHRSFWSLSVKQDANTNPAINYTYRQIANNKMGSCVYTLPNTLQYANDFADKYNNRLTKFIVAAQLRYKDANGQWQDAEICEYKGIQYIGHDMVLDAIGHDSQIYVKTTGADGDTYTSIGHDDMQLSADNNQNTKDYKAIATVTTPIGIGVPSRDDLYKKNAAGTFTSLTADQANAILAKETADVRENGMTYYYTPIRHLGTDPQKPAYYGIVRNHHYRIALTSLKGFGTPVIDENKIIIPTIPDNEATYLAARINVLSWRVVKQNADLDSGNN